MAVDGNLPVDYGWLLDPALVMWCVTCVRQLSAQELLSAVGAQVDADVEWDAGEAQAQAYQQGGVGVRVAPVGDWSVLIELQSLKGADGAWLQQTSRGREAVCFHHSGSGMEMFSYAADGVLVTEFEPAIAARRSGSNPEHLTSDMRAVGIDPEGVSTGADLGVAALQLMERVTGVRVTSELVISERWPSGVVPRRRRH